MLKNYEYEIGVIDFGFLSVLFLIVRSGKIDKYRFFKKSTVLYQPLRIEGTRNLE